MNGEQNAARPVALSAMFTLCISLAVFWWAFPMLLNFSKYSRRAMQFSGIISTAIAMFIFTGYHDAIINIAGALALIALFGTYAGLYKCKWAFLFGFGVFNLLLIGVNNYIYYGRGLLAYLPVVQKFSFISFIAWICLITIKLYKRNRQKDNYQQ